MNLNLESVPRVITACCVLHNIARAAGIAMEEEEGGEGQDPGQDPEHDDPHQGLAYDAADGRGVRRALIEQRF